MINNELQVSVPSKIVAGSQYIHLDYVESLPKALRQTIASVAGNGTIEFNIVRVDKNSTVALLNYSNIEQDAFPQLISSCLINIESQDFVLRDFSNSINPPILHRKELLLDPAHNYYEKYYRLTKACEEIGLFDNPTKIGFQKQWLRLIYDAGYQLDGHDLIPLANSDSLTIEGGFEEVIHEWKAARHLTALTRYGFSAPVQSLMRYGFLSGKYTLFDYGCGRGSDVKGLSDNDLSVSGWDPYYAPDAPKTCADIVNLGFVINVIESVDERAEALIDAYSFADKLLVVSVMLENSNRASGESFNDGVITKRGTFQKYFTQGEIKYFIETALAVEAIAVAPGIHYVFSNKDEEQRFLSSRYRGRSARLRSPSPLTKEKKAQNELAKDNERYERHKEPLDRLWLQWLSLGRRPDKSECTDLLVLAEGFGTFNKALRFIEGRNDPKLIEAVEQSRIEDIQVYFALNQFQQRAAYKHMEAGLQRDIKIFFGSYREAQNEARDLLFNIANVELVQAACKYAAEHGLGWLEEGESLQMHTSLVEQLPPILRVYIGCASVLYGDYRNADIVKVHICSGKLTLISYDDFDGSPLPKMIKRVKILLRDQDLEYFEYGEEYPEPYLYHKSRYINEEYLCYPEQLVFEEQLAMLGELDLSGFGLSVVEFDSILRKRRFAISGYDLKPSCEVPDLDDSCGKYLTFRDLIECGETQSELCMDNLPKQVETYNALYALAYRVIDPVIDYFGMVKLTYGFCSPELSRKIPARIDPKRDQHASHEVNRLGNLVCDRLGAACDFIVEDESMLEVAQWVVENTEFDRLYYYGDKLPIHVSYGPNFDRQIVVMLPSKAKRLVPKVVNVEKFMRFVRS
ncbi:MAG: DNA phosphorothioation-associated putative methyltransferase [Candidatus Marinimicrobia bacterium]|jgi:DNA phosphorothioation-associated putative methyltransferase|nr:DNA phosphorothioation-associated putative methyltransferase [Candidatus Neomarinimicrobiota bacterium]MBT4948018.1 DNA phosphorothioation-associated putative methyltransferase [Candidatus Neomarinimicrobiota bacterium]MBT5269780.1 DNA phosphorothioation-associated putative methyltransferase [Candidatus Neomarinimicrobiota bacterium]